MHPVTILNVNKTNTNKDSEEKMKQKTNHSNFRFHILTTAMLMLCACSSVDNSFTTDYLAVQFSEGENWSIVDKDGKVVIKEEYDKQDEISFIYDGVFWVKHDGKYQLFSIDSPQKPISKEEYDEVTDFVAGRSAVTSKGHPIQIINTDGEMVSTLPSSITRVSEYKENGLAIYKEEIKGAMGWLNLAGLMMYEGPCKDIFIGKDKNNILVKESNDSIYYIYNSNGMTLGTILRDKYLPLGWYSEGLLPVASNSEGNTEPEAETPVVMLDPQGKKQFTLKKADAQHSIGSYYYDGYYVYTTSDNYCGIADKNGSEIMRAKYQYLKNIGESQFLAEKNDKWGIINADDEVIVPFEYDGFSAKPRLGDNYVMREGDYFYIVGSDGKKISNEGFFQISYSPCPLQITYVNTDELAEMIAKIVNDTESGLTSAMFANKYGLELTYEATHSSMITLRRYNDLFEVKLSYQFNNIMAKEISDQLVWTDAVLYSNTLTMDVSQMPIDIEPLVKAVASQLSAKGFQTLPSGELGLGNKAVRVTNEFNTLKIYCTYSK